jgi:cellulose synthase/poly-beta-1,6-N-acetylglucosamine synthase-like glycosyltransferase
MMITLLTAFGAVIALITLPGTLELLVLSVAGLLKPRRVSGAAACKTRMAVVVPAHNEEAGITRCVESLLRMECGDDEITVVVVADNCDDRTAELARAAGARVLVRGNTVERGKGYALDFAFRTLLPEGYDAFAVVDADSEIEPNFARVTADIFRAGADAVQCRYLVRNTNDSVRTRLMSVAMEAFNVLRPRGRDRCGLSAGIYGNGFALSARTLRAVPYSAASVVEDLEYHLALVRAGRRVRFADSTAVYGDMPVAGPGVKTQRTRWEGGRFRMIAAKVPVLLRELLRGRFALLEPCMDLLLLPLAFHLTLLALAAATPFWPVRSVALAGIGVVIFHLFAAIRVGGGGSSSYVALLSAPLYIVWKILLIPRLIKSSRSDAAWVRTERAPGQNIP